MNVYITGYGFTKLNRHYNKSLEDLAYEAIHKAIEGKDPKIIDTLIIANSFSPLLQSQNLLAPLIAEDAGLKGIRVFTVENGGASGITAIDLASALVRTGDAKNVIVVGVEKLSDYNADIMNKALAQLVNAEYEAFYGANLISQYALIANSYLRKYGISEELLAEWPVLMHDNAAETYHAQLRFRITVDKVVSSDYVSPPLRLQHAPPMSDGAAAILISSQDSSIEKDERIAMIKASAIMSGLVEITLRNDLTMLPCAKKMFTLIQEKANIVLKEIDAIDVTDKYSIGGPILLESIGLTEPGRSLYEIKEGRYRLGDKPMINLTGGTKARGDPIGATGVYQVAELTALIKGDKIRNGAPTIETGLAIAIGGTGGVSAGVLLEKT